MPDEFAPNLNHAWSRLIVDELVRLGAGCFVLSPGSRSTPLTTAVAQHPRAPHIMHFDERGAAFYALGRAKASGKPTVLICTSGSAGANYWPAVVEASQSQVPLIILTADRPPELLQCGANQAIEQTRLFGSYARAFHALPCPSLALPAAAVLTTVDDAHAAATGAHAGPVHINCAFREPLALEPDGLDLKPYLAPVDAWLDSDRPYTRQASTRTVLDSEGDRDLLERLEDVEKGVLVIGTLRTAFDRAMAAKLAATLGWPVLPDFTSGLRLGLDAPHVVHHYDQLLLSEKFRMAFRPDFVMHLGGRLVSKRLAQHLKACRAEYLHVDDATGRLDPDHQVARRVVQDAGSFCAWLLPYLGRGATPAWSIDAPALSRETARLLDEHLPATGRLSEIGVAHVLTKERPAGSLLFAGNSMPVRELDMYGAADAPAGFDAASRGASGIDGNIATAVGMADALNAPATALIGDLTALHDLNSLALLRGVRRPFALVIVNNDGGGIFHFLPIAKEAAVFEPYFGTPHGLRFEQAAAMFDFEYAQPRNLDSFRDEYRHAMEENAPMIIEVRTDRALNADAHRALQARIAEAIDARME
ncbi:MAG: 2-succinyl-5-enolpyruvyl-6-hydroxy-3-cyclohexene-1-carboxylic-acid synthase [Candidatus Hydrogenedens sp.]|nr:2-succinyl-5-enolpyruvyl-6-hydroxy-3-cyclohexene-1-carboxylic-acid synthase [Candidatus Hydrogenedens sp.]